MILKDFKVTAMATDITDLVQSMTLFESINGFMKGKIQILDGANFFDNDMGGRDEILIPITIDFRHLDFECTNHFWVDGVSQMKIDKSEKSYTMHLISPLEQGFKLNKICQVYTDTSTGMVQRIFKEAAGPESTLVVNTASVTKGKYIVPNIQAGQAINNIVSSAVDATGSGFYLFQRIWENGHSRLISLDTMASDFYPNSDGTGAFEITSPLPDLCNLEHGVEVPIVGTSNNFTVTQYKMNYTNKLAEGHFGQQINQISLDKTKTIKNNPIEAGTTKSSYVRTSDNLYDNYQIEAGLAIERPSLGKHDNYYWDLPDDATRLIWIGDGVKQSQVNDKGNPFPTPLRYNLLFTDDKWDGSLSYYKFQLESGFKSSLWDDHRENQRDYISKLENERERILAGIRVLDTADSWRSISIFQSATNPSDQTAVNQKKRIYNTALSVKDMSPIPMCGCGHSVKVKQGGADQSVTSSDGPYIIADINHLFQVSDTGVDYRTNLQLIREM